MQAHGSQSLSELCLRFPDVIGIHPTISYEVAVSMLLRAGQLAMQQPFVWGYIDKPADGSVFLTCSIPQQPVFPNDGIRYQENEHRYTMTVVGRELEIHEIKYGFVPDGTDPVAYRVRRRFRLAKGGYPQLQLVHYSRGQQTAIMPNFAGQPVRQYPLRQVNEPATYVLGEKIGQKVPNMYPNPTQVGHVGHPGHPVHPGAPQMGASSSMGGMPGVPMVGGMSAQAHQAMLAQQTREMEAMDRRQQRARGLPGAAVRIDDEDSGDEHEHISTRSLALARYKRNHDYMNEVFNHAAFSSKKQPELKSPYHMFDKDDLRQKQEKLAREVEELKAKAAARAEARSRLNAAEANENFGNDVTMGDLVPGPSSEPIAV